MLNFILKHRKLQLFIITGTITFGIASYFILSQILSPVNNFNMSNASIYGDINNVISSLSQLIDFSTTFNEIFPLENSTMTQFIDLSGLNSFIYKNYITELRLHYIIQDKPLYNNFLSNQLNMNVSVFQYDSNDKRLYNDFDYYCPLTYISPNKTDALYQSIGWDICNSVTYSNFTQFLIQNPNQTSVQWRQRLFDDDIILDIGKYTNNGFIIVAITLKEFFESILNTNTIFVNAFFNDDLIYTTINNIDLMYYTSDNYIRLFGTTLNIQLLHKYPERFYIYFIIFFTFLVYFISNYILFNIYKTSSVKKQLNQFKYSNELLGYVNHELRNPLNSIQGLIHLSIDDIDNKDDAEIVAIIKSNLHTAENSCIMINHIVNDILDMTKLQTMKLTIHEEPVDIHVLFNDLKKILLQKSEEYPDVSFITETNIDTITFDRHRLLQILLNFITNSYKFTESGSIVLSFFRDSQNDITISVKDTGRGVDTKTKHKLFKPYEQQYNSDALRHGGMGLGLYICKMLADLMNVEIGLIDQTIGSLFYIKKYSI
jgi:signal transduction histidine kinase